LPLLAHMPNKAVHRLQISSGRGLRYFVFVLLIMVLASQSTSVRAQDESWPKGFVTLAQQIGSSNLPLFTDNFEPYRQAAFNLTGEEKLQALFFVVTHDYRRDHATFEEDLTYFRDEVRLQQSSRYTYFVELFDALPREIAEEPINKSIEQLETMLATKELDPGQQIYTQASIMVLFDMLGKLYRTLDLIDEITPLVETSSSSDYQLEKLFYYEVANYSANFLKEGAQALAAAEHYFELLPQGNYPNFADAFLHNSAALLLKQKHTDEAIAVNQVLRDLSRQQKDSSSQFLSALLCGRIANEQENYEHALSCLKEASIGFSVQVTSGV